MSLPVSVVVLAYGTEEWLHECVSSVVASEGVDPEIIIVDNGCSERALSSVRAIPGVTVVTPSRNLGFAGGVNAGMRHASHDVRILLNSDAWVAPDTLARLAGETTGPEAGITGALVLLADYPDRINSAGNPLHVLGLSWAGRMNEPADNAPPVTDDVASASGACLAIHRSLWERLGGFWDEYFAYLEDMELSWRTRQLGLPVRVLASAKVWHHYEFSRTDIKAYLLERNRLIFLLTCHERRTLLTLALPLAALEVAMFALACAQGWGRQKARGWAWVVRNAPAVRRRRALIQRARSVSDAELAPLLVDTFSASQLPMPAAGRPLERIFQSYWSVVRRRLTHSLSTNDSR